MSIKRNHDALESLPLKMMIVAIVASMSVIPAGQALDGFRNRDYMTRIQLQLDGVISAAQTLMIEGPGGVRTLHFDFKKDGQMGFEGLSIGDERGGPNMSSVILRLAGGGMVVKTATEPQVWMMGNSGSALTIFNPAFDLRLSAQLGNRTAYVLMELV